MGKAAVEEIEKRVGAARKAGTKEIALLKCATSYGVLAEQINLRRIPEVSGPGGMSDIEPGISLCQDLVGAR
jgi:sialic acid synthase SpsE